MKILFNLKYQEISRSDNNLIAASSKNYVTAKFVPMSFDWVKPITAIFGDYCVELDNNMECIVPWEVLENPGKVKVSAFCGDLHTSNIVIIDVVESGYKQGETPQDPTPDLYHEITQKVNEAVNISQEALEKSESSQIYAEEAKNSAEVAKEAKNQASDHAERSLIASESASSSSRLASDSASAAAASAAAAAESESNAAASASAASASAAAASASESNAAESASAASNSAVAAAVSESAAAESASAASASAEAAALSEGNSAASANAASGSASAAATSESNAAESASAASASAEAAAASEGAAANSAEEAKQDYTSLLQRIASLEIIISSLNAPGAGAHNAIYRGKFLGESVTEAQYAAIADGTFADLYIGDYWTINDRVYRIAAFDYLLSTGDINCTTHHVLMVPDKSLYSHIMNDTNITTGAYVGSKMYAEGLERAKTTIKAAFGGHVLSKRIYLSNATTNGKASAGVWCDSEVDLMCEHMVYGNGVFSPVSDGTTVPNNYRIEKSQLPLFQHEPSRIYNRASWWLRDVISDSRFALVYLTGNATCRTASESNGVRPYFCIY